MQADGRADRHDETNDRFSQFCVAPKNGICSVRRTRVVVSLTVITNVQLFSEMLRSRVPNFVHIG